MDRLCLIRAIQLLEFWGKQVAATKKETYREPPPPNPDADDEMQKQVFQMGTMLDKAPAPMPRQMRDLIDWAEEEKSKRRGLS